MIKNHNKNSNDNTTKTLSKKQPIEFIVTNNFSGTRNLADILAKLAMSEINGTVSEDKKQNIN